MPLALAAGGTALFLVLGILETFLTTDENSQPINDGVAWVVPLIMVAADAAISFLFVRTILRYDGRQVLNIGASFAIALVCSATMIGAFVAGIWVPFLLGWGGRTVRELELVRDENLGDILRPFAYSGGVLAVVVGIFSGFVAWLSQFLRWLPDFRKTAARLPWPWHIGLSIPLLLGFALAFGALISWLGDGYEPPEELNAGRVDPFAVGAPKLYEEADIWLVRLSQAEFVALYDRGVESGCPLQWRPEYEFMGRRGWFVDACNGAAYDLTGRCLSDTCRGTLLERFNVAIAAGEVIVDLRGFPPLPPPDPRATPFNPAG
jgi:hypothetical protein